MEVARLIAKIALVAAMAWGLTRLPRVESWATDAADDGATSAAVW